MEKRLSCVCESSNETGGYSLRFVAIEFLFISSVRGDRKRGGIRRKLAGTREMGATRA